MNDGPLTTKDKVWLLIAAFCMSLIIYLFIVIFLSMCPPGAQC